MAQKYQPRIRRGKTMMNKQIVALLILAVTLILLVLILTSGQTWLGVLAVTVVLIALILVVGGTPELLPGTLRAIWV